MAQRQRLPRPILISSRQRRIVSPAAVVAATRSASDSILRCGKGEWFRLQNGLAAKVILDFKPRLANRCKLFPVYTLFRASILDFKPRLANRCSIIVVTVENGPPAMAVAATTFRVRF